MPNTLSSHIFNGLHELGTDPGTFVAGLFGDLFGGKRDAKGGTGEGKGGTGNGKDGKDNSAAARAALQALRTDPASFLKQAFPLLFSAPAGAQDAGR